MVFLRLLSRWTTTVLSQFRTGAPVAADVRLLKRRQRANNGVTVDYEESNYPSGNDGRHYFNDQRGHNGNRGYNGYRGNNNYNREYNNYRGDNNNREYNNYRGNNNNREYNNYRGDNNYRPCLSPLPSAITCRQSLETLQPQAYSPFTLNSLCSYIFLRSLSADLPYIPTFWT